MTELTRFTVGPKKNYETIQAAIFDAEALVKETGVQQTILIFQKEDGSAYDDGDFEVSESLYFSAWPEQISNTFGNAYSSPVSVKGTWSLKGQGNIVLSGLFLQGQDSDSQALLDIDRDAYTDAVFIRNCRLEGANSSFPVMDCKQAELRLLSVYITQDENNAQAALEVGSSGSIAIAAGKDVFINHKGKSSSSGRQSIHVKSGSFSKVDFTDSTLNGPVKIESGCQMEFSGGRSLLITQANSDPCFECEGTVVLNSCQLRTEGSGSHIISGSGDVFSGNCIIDRFSTTNTVSPSITLTDLSNLS